MSARWRWLVLLPMLLLGACDDDDNTPPATPQSSTGQVLTAARSTSSESGEPFAVNNGAFVMNDTSETADPSPVTR